MQDNPPFLFNDGVGGTKNHCPPFQETLKRAEMRKVRSFMVTDLSHLYRNQAYVNEQMEEIFSFFHVQLISIAEGYDNLTNYLNYLSPQELMPKLVHMFVESIAIHGRSEPSKLQTLDIYFYWKIGVKKQRECSQRIPSIV